MKITATITIFPFLMLIASSGIHGAACSTASRDADDLLKARKILFALKKDNPPVGPGLPEELRKEVCSFVRGIDRQSLEVPELPAELPCADFQACFISNSGNMAVLKDTGTLLHLDAQGAIIDSAKVRDATIGRRSDWRSRDQFFREISTVRVSPNGKCIATVGNSTLCDGSLPETSSLKDILQIRSIDNVHQKPLHVHDAYSPHDWRFSADGTRIIASVSEYARTPESLRVYDIEANAPVAQMQAQSAIVHVALSRDSNLIAMGDKERVSFGDVRAGHVAQLLDRPCKDLLFLPDNRLIVMTPEGEIIMKDLRADVRIVLGAGSTNLAASQDGSKVVAGGQEGRNVQVWNVAAGNPEQIIDDTFLDMPWVSPAKNIDITPDGMTILRTRRRKDDMRHGNYPWIDQYAFFDAESVLRAAQRDAVLRTDKKPTGVAASAAAPIHAPAGAAAYVGPGPGPTA